MCEVLVKEANLYGQIAVDYNMFKLLQNYLMPYSRTVNTDFRDDFEHFKWASLQIKEARRNGKLTCLNELSNGLEIA